MTSSVTAGPARTNLARRYRLILVAILLVAAILRIHGLDNVSPPGLEHDEVAHWLINREILAGNHGIYFAEAYGHEAAFHYVQAGFMALLGDNAFVLRLPSAFTGLLLVAVTFALVRRLFGLRNALLAAGLAAALFWPVFYSRLALRAIFLPLVSGFSAYLWWRGWLATTGAAGGRRATHHRRESGLIWFAAAGLLAGLALYTYMASRVLPLFYGLFLVYLLLCHRSALLKRKMGVALFFGVFALVAVPLLVYLLSHSGIESRIGEVDAPLRALMRGNLKPALENTLKVMAMFGLRGDPLWRQNIAYLPVFDVVVALFFGLGLVISLWRWRQARHMFVVLWLFTSAIPSIVTIDAPSSIRIINVLPILVAFPAIGLEVIHLFRPLSTVFSYLSPVLRRNIAIVGLLLVFIWHIGRTWRGIFDIWPVNSEVQFVWQQALTEAAHYLDSDARDGSVAVGGWTPDTMDPPTMALTLKRDDLSLRFFDPGRAVIVPPGGRIVYPTALPLQATLAEPLLAQGIQPQPMGAFTLTDAGPAYSGLSSLPPLEEFADELDLLAYRANQVAGSLQIVLVLRVEQPPGSSRRIFLHLVDESGEIVAQDDALGAPAQYWKAGDLIIQSHSLALPAVSGGLQIRMGLYDPGSGLRLLTASGAEFMVIPVTMRSP
jgi:4-amino-4-deoxy-L-arabinose transferase-like glycosyltransferase